MDPIRISRVAVPPVGILKKTANCGKNVTRVKQVLSTDVYSAVKSKDPVKKRAERFLREINKEFSNQDVMESSKLGYDFRGLYRVFGESEPYTGLTIEKLPNFESFYKFENGVQVASIYKIKNGGYAYTKGAKEIIYNPEKGSISIYRCMSKDGKFGYWNKTYTKDGGQGGHFVKMFS